MADAMTREEQPIVFATTADRDIHAFYGEIDLVRMKAERNKWIETVDGRFVRTTGIVSLWIPAPEEIEGYFGQEEGLWT